MLSVYYYLIFIKYLIFEKNKTINLYYIELKTIQLLYFIILVSFLIVIFFFILSEFYQLTNLLALKCKFPLSNDSLFLVNKTIF